MITSETLRISCPDAASMEELSSHISAAYAVAAQILSKNTNAVQRADGLEIIVRRNGIQNRLFFT